MFSIKYCYQVIKILSNNILEIRPKPLCFFPACFFFPPCSLNLCPWTLVRKEWVLLISYLDSLIARMFYFLHVVKMFNRNLTVFAFCEYRLNLLYLWSQFRTSRLRASILFACFTFLLLYFLFIPFPLAIWSFLWFFHFFWFNFYFILIYF